MGKEELENLENKAAQEEVDKEIAERIKKPKEILMQDLEKISIMQKMTGKLNKHKKARDTSESTVLDLEAESLVV